MNSWHSKRRTRITLGLVGVFLLVLGATLLIIVVTRHTPVVLIPFASATFISLGAIWYAHHGDCELSQSPPFGVEKITPNSSDTGSAKPVDWVQHTWPGQRSER